MEEKVKFLRFSKDTVKRLFKYISSERKEYDFNHYDFDELPDDASLFLTSKGTSFNYPAWYYHWNRAMKASNIKLNPHKARHWFVTTRLREIYKITKSDAEIQQRKNELIKYMKWKNSDTILIYEHRFDEKKHREAHDQMLEGMKQNEKSYEKKRNSK